MGKYGAVAVRAKQLHEEGTQSMASAWRRAAEEVFPDAPESIIKSCPWVAFRGLCEAGFVVGVPAPPSDDLIESASGTYAVTAAHILAAEPALAADGPTKLWRRVMAELGLDTSKRHNGQMDVVLSLWTSGSLFNPGEQVHPR